MKVLLLALPLLLLAPQPDPELVALQKRVAKLELAISKVETYYEAFAGTEQGLYIGEEAIVNDLIRLKKRVRECCGVGGMK